MNNFIDNAIKEFEKEFLYWVVLGSTLNDGSELQWNVGEGKLPNIDKIKAFIKQTLLKHHISILQEEIERLKIMEIDEDTEAYHDYYESNSGYNEAIKSQIDRLKTKVKKLQKEIKQMKETEIKCQYCGEEAEWVTDNPLDIRASCDNHREKLEKEIKQ